MADGEERDVTTACPWCLSGNGSGLGHSACEYSPYLHCPHWAAQEPHFDGSTWSTKVARVGEAGHLLRVAEVVLGQRPTHPRGPPICHQDNWWCASCQHRRTHARRWHGEEVAVKRWTLGDIQQAGEEVAQGLHLTRSQCREVLWDVLILLEEKTEREWRAIQDAIICAAQEPHKHKLQLSTAQQEIVEEVGYL